jgi:hypothetical protein
VSKKPLQHARERSVALQKKNRIKTIGLEEWKNKDIGLIVSNVLKQILKRMIRICHVLVMMTNPIELTMAK